MGRPPSNGGPSFRFNHTEVVEMEAILQAHNAQMPTREVLDALAEKFSTSAERSGKVVVQMKQIWNWFQNRRYAIRAKAGKPPAKLTVSTPQNNSTTTTKNVPLAPQPVPKNVPLAPQPVPSTTAVMRSVPQNTKITAPPPVSVQDSVKNVLESQMEFEARSASDGAWYDVASFLSHRIVETGDPEVLVRFSGFGPEEDEWIDVRKHIRQRSLPCESSECIVVLPGDLILCFQEGKEQALYYDAHILDSQRRRHDIRGCRCRFLVRYDHDQSEEIVPLRKICRRPETDHRLQQLDAESGKVNQQKSGTDAVSDTNTKCSPVMKTAQKAHKLDQTADNHIPKVNQNTELAQPIGNTCSDSIATQVVPATESHTTQAEKELNKISELTEPHIAKTGSDSIATQVLAATENQETLVQKVTEISDLTQPPIEKTVSDSITTQELSETESHANVVDKVNQSTHLLVAETETDTLAVDAVKVNETSESIQLPPLAETERPLAAPENHEVVTAAAFTQNSLPPKPVESDSVKSPDLPLQTG